MGRFVFQTFFSSRKLFVCPRISSFEVRRECRARSRQTMSFQFNRGISSMTIHNHSYSAPVFIGGDPGSGMGGPMTQLGHSMPPSSARPSAAAEMTPRLEASRWTGKRRASSFMVVNHSIECEAEVDRFVKSLHLSEYSQPEKVSKALRRLGRFCCGDWEELKRASTMSRYVEQLRSFSERGDLAKSTVKNEVHAVSLALRVLAKEFPRGDTFAEAIAEISGKRRRVNRDAMKSQNNSRVVRLQRLPSLEDVRQALREDPTLQLGAEASLTRPEARRFRMGLTVLYLYAFGNFARKEALKELLLRDVLDLSRGEVFASGALKNWRSFEGTCAYVASEEARAVLEEMYLWRIDDGACDEDPFFISIRKEGLKRPEQCMTFALSRSSLASHNLTTTDFRRIVEKLATGSLRIGIITEEERRVIAKSQNHSVEVANAVYAGQAGAVRPDLQRQERAYIDELKDNEMRASEIIERMLPRNLFQDDDDMLGPPSPGLGASSAPVSPDVDAAAAPASSAPAADGEWSDEDMTLQELVARHAAAEAVSPDDVVEPRGRKCSFVACNCRELPAALCRRCRKKQTHHLCAIAYAEKYAVRPFDAPTYCNSCLRAKMKTEKNWSQQRRSSAPAAAAAAASLP